MSEPQRVVEALGTVGRIVDDEKETHAGSTFISTSPAVLGLTEDIQIVIQLFN